MAIGTVKFFDLAKGFGFIVPADGGKDIFGHKTAVESAGMSDLANRYWLAPCRVSGLVALEIP